MDFLKDWLAPERQFRVFTLEDLSSREALALEFDFSLPAVRVIRELQIVAAQRGYPTYLRVDNGPAFISKALDAWAYQQYLTPEEFATSLAGSPAAPVRPQDQEPELTAGGVT